MADAGLRGTYPSRTDLTSIAASTNACTAATAGRHMPLPAKNLIYRPVNRFANASDMTAKRLRMEMPCVTKCLTGKNQRCRLMLQIFDVVVSRHGTHSLEQCVNSACCSRFTRSFKGRLAFLHIFS